MIHVNQKYKLLSSDPVTTERKRAVRFEDGTEGFIDVYWNGGQLYLGQPYRESPRDEQNVCDYLERLNSQ